MKRNKRKVISKIMAAAMAMMLCVGTAVPAMAGTGGTAATPQKAVLTKNLRFANAAGLTTPAASFTYNFSKTSLDNSSAAADLADMPNLGPATVNFTAGEASTPASGMQQVSKTVDVLSGITWTRTGVYEYYVTENATGFSPAAGESMIYSQAEYKLYVVIDYDSGVYFPETTYTEKIKDDGGSAASGKGDPNDPADPSYNFIFNNIYTKVGGSTPGTDALTITKTTTGTGSDPTKLFNFTLKADDTPTGLLTHGTYTGTYTPAGGTPSAVSLVADGATPLTFTMKSGDKLVIDNAPAGTAFEVEETGTPSYIPSYAGTVGASVAISNTAAVGANLATGTQVVGAINNEVNYTNAFDSSLIPTGILNNMAPIAAIIAVAVLGFVAFAVINRRKATR